MLRVMKGVEAHQLWYHSFTEAMGEGAVPPEGGALEAI